MNTQYTPGHAIDERAKAVNFTPGPWLTKELQVYAEYGNGSTLAHVYDPSRDHDHSEAEANARLIAAAPELLEACKAALQYIEDQIEQQGGCDHSVGICACPEIRLAEKLNTTISKATKP